MQNLEKLLSERGVSASDLVVSGRRAPSHARFDPNDAALGVAAVSLTRDGTEALRLEPGDPAHGEIAMALMLASGVRRKYARPGPDGLAPFEIPLASLAEMAAAVRAARRGGPDAEDSAWTLFRLTDAFERQPCERADFDLARADFRRSDFLASMTFGDYYGWWRDSCAHVGPDGALTDKARASLDRMLDAWAADKDRESLMFWTCRNMEPSVHPLHRALVEAVVDERLATAAPAP